MTDYHGCTAELDSSSEVQADDDEPIARCYSEARRLGIKKYSGKACPEGHTVRYTSSGSCIGCCAAQQKAYYDRDPERRRAKAREYAEQNADKIRAYDQAQRERIRACDKERPEGMIIARKAAIEAGYTTYYPGPCKAGHTSGRRLEGCCIDCQSEYGKARGRTDADRARDAEAARARRAAKAAETAERRAAKVAERERVRAERERAKAERAAARRYEPRIASPKLSDEERAAIEQARAAKAAERAERERVRAERAAAREQARAAKLEEARQRVIERARRTERAKAEQERRRELAAQRTDTIERARVLVEHKVETAKAAGEPHKRLARAERELARAKVTNDRRATGTAAAKSLSEEEAAAIDAALGAGKVTRIESGTWDEHIEKRRAAETKPSPFRRW